jgi:hypothetical protein
VLDKLGKKNVGYIAEKYLQNEVAYLKCYICTNKNVTFRILFAALVEFMQHNFTTSKNIGDRRHIL